MELIDFIIFRKKIQDIELTSYGFKGTYQIKATSDLELIKKFKSSELRELYYKENNNSASLDELSINETLTVVIDLSKFPNYFESFSVFINFNKYELKSDEFYILELDYLYNSNISNKLFEKYKLLQQIISFLRRLSSHEKNTKGIIELFFQKPNKICSIEISYNENNIENIHITKSISELEQHVFEKSDEETRRKLFSNEMINFLTQKDYSFSTLLEYWDAIDNSYRSSFQIYLSEFSFEKIKTSSQEYFHELTDRIYSTIHKFSAYILAIPVAYIFILRFFDFSGESFPKDSFLLFIAILYFLIIWFVLLNNLSKAFISIQNDIDKFLKRIKDEETLSEIVESLNTQRDKLIPSQKNKILIVQTISILILIMIMGAYIFIYHPILMKIFHSVVQACF